MARPAYAPYPYAGGYAAPAPVGYPPQQYGYAPQPAYAAAYGQPDYAAQQSAAYDPNQQQYGES